ncbi:trichohyalin-like [Phymastichus coffea]|uniref:trichohyalin-like n=1 Tax=Phymastichus coffea TaxID=108790 RepID=UPI00273B7B3A|nr:trichohyalin-like [Phymastichus coffea]
MSCTDKSTAIGVLNVKKSPYLENLRKCVPEPKVAALDSGLPRWSRLPLEAKIPVMPHVTDALLSRRKLGERLWIEYVDRKRFVDCSDPYSREVNIPYEGLHDEHLARFFLQSHRLREFLIKTEIITPGLDVKCNLWEYNTYRNYLRIMHGKAMKRELVERDELLKEKLVLDIADGQALKNNEKLKKQEVRQARLGELEAKRAAKIRRIFDKDRADGARLAELWEKQRQETRNKIVRLKVQMNRIKQRRFLMAKLEQQRILNSFREWNERDRQFRKRMEQMEGNKRRKKIEVALERFDKKKTSQEEAIENELRVRECVEQSKSEFLREYQKKLDDSQRKLRELFEEKRAALEKALKRPRRARRKAKKIGTCYCKVD